MSNVLLSNEVIISTSLAVYILLILGGYRKECLISRPWEGIGNEDVKDRTPYHPNKSVELNPPVYMILINSYKSFHVYHNKSMAKVSCYVGPQQNQQTKPTNRTQRY